MTARGSYQPEMGGPLRWTIEGDDGALIAASISGSLAFAMYAAAMKERQGNQVVLKDAGNVVATYTGPVLTQRATRLS